MKTYGKHRFPGRLFVVEGTRTYMSLSRGF